MNPLRSLTLLLALSLPFYFGACKPGTSSSGGGGGTGAASGSGKVIGSTMKNANNPFFKVIADNLKEAAEESGYSVISLSGNEDVTTQGNQIKDFITKGVSAIVLAPVDSKSIGPAIVEANEAGIPVFTVDDACVDPKAKIVSHIATDNLQGGRLAGDAMLEVLGETGGKVLILDYKVANSCQLRVQGFKEIIDAHNAKDGNKKVTIVAELAGGAAKEKSRESAAAALKSHTDLDGIFAINDPSALGAYAALAQANRTDVHLIGFDGELEGKKAILDGKIYADPIQFPDQMGKDVVKAIIAHFNGEEVAPVQLIPASLYKKADAEKEFGTN